MRIALVTCCVLGCSGEALAQSCAVGTVPAPGKLCSISDYSVGGPVKSTDAVAMCQQVGGCNATSPTITYTQVPMSSLMSQFKVTWPDALYGGVYSYLNNIARLPVGAINGGPSKSNAGTYTSARTSDVTPPNTCCSISSASFTYNDNTATPQSSWGTYNTNLRASGAGSTFGTEYDVGNLGTLVPLDVYTTGTGWTIPLWVSCGGELNSTSYAGSLNPCTAAMHVTWNGAPFDKGIGFQAAALVNHGGATWPINLPSGGMVRWEIAGNNTGAFVLGTISGVSTANGLMFTDIGAQFHTITGAVMASINLVTNPVNFPSMTAAVTGGGVTYGADGSDAFVDLILKAKESASGGSIRAGNAFRLQTRVVLNLPTCNSTSEGDLIAVTDSSSGTWGAVVTPGGGTNHVIGYCNGTSWLVH